MKAYLASLLIFCLLLIGITCNYFYVNTTADSLYLMAARLPEEEDASPYTAVSDLEGIWESHKNRLSLSVNSHTLSQISNLIATLKVLSAPTEGTESTECSMEYRTQCALLLQAILELRHMENWNIWNFV